MNSSIDSGVYPHGIKLGGVDVGTVRVGLAICDPDGILATPPFKTVGRDSKKNSDVRVVVKHAAELPAVQIFVGLPRTMKARNARLPKWPWTTRTFLPVSFRAPVWTFP